MTYGCSRRYFLSLITSVSLAGQKTAPRSKGPALPRAGEFFRYLDAQTEQPVVRLTALSSASFLPPSANRISPPRERFLLFASDRGGALAPYKMDLRTGTAGQLADPSHLDLNSLQLSGSGRSVYFIDGGALTEVGLQNRKNTTLAEGVRAFSPGPLANEYSFVRQGKLFHSARAGRVLADDVSDYCSARPGQAACLCLRNGRKELWLATFRDGDDPRLTMIANGNVTEPCWSPDGRTLLFLRRRLTGSRSEEVVISEVTPEEGPASERIVARTSRYGCFAPNSDSSVFVGSSVSKAQPFILLLVRSVRREMTLCEHHARETAMVNPSFSPDNRRIYFASDFQGRPAIYAVNVEQLVEPAPS